MSTYHLLVKFLTPQGVDEIRENQLLARQCYSTSLQASPPEALSLEPMDSWDEEKIIRAEAIEELLSIALDDQSSEKHVKVSSRLSPEEANELTRTL